jgi:hypothetical protein
MTKINKIFKIAVWYRYVVFGEQEKDYDMHEVEALSLKEALKKSLELYPSRSKIPFSLECGILTFKPSQL